MDDLEHVTYDFIYGVKAVFGWIRRDKMANVSFFSLFACEWIPELPLHFWEIWVSQNGA